MCCVTAWPTDNSAATTRPHWRTCSTHPGSVRCSSPGWGSRYVKPPPASPRSNEYPPSRARSTCGPSHGHWSPARRNDHPTGPDPELCTLCGCRATCRRNGTAWRSGGQHRRVAVTAVTLAHAVCWPHASQLRQRRDRIRGVALVVAEQPSRTSKRRTVTTVTGSALQQRRDPTLHERAERWEERLAIPVLVAALVSVPAVFLVTTTAGVS